MKNLFKILFLFLIFISCGEDKKIEKSKNNEVSHRLKVTTEKILFQKFEHYFEINGSVEAEKSAFVSPETNGQIKKIHVKEGDRVRKGDLLVELNTKILENSLEEIKTALELSKIIFKKQDELWKQKIGSEIQYLQAKNQKESLERKLETLESQLDMGKVKAPISGIIDDIFLKKGEMAAAGMQLIQLINLRSVYVNADVSESYLSKIKKGDLVNLNFPSYPDFNKNAKIYRIGNFINPSNRTFKIEIRLENRDEKLKPNLLAMLKIKDFYEEKAILIESEIIKKDAKGEYLYVKTKNNNKYFAKKTYIETGVSDNEKTMITKGLQVNQEVIKDGYNIVKDGMEIYF